MDGRRRSVLRVLVEKGGLRPAFRAATYLASWGACFEQLGRRPTWEEYTEFWKHSNATTARDVAAFKRCCDLPVWVVWDSLAETTRVGVRRQGREVSVADVATARWSL